MQLLLQWKSNKYYTTWVSICSPRYPAYNVHVPYCHVACPTLQYFSTISHKWHNYQKKVTEHQTCVSTFSITFIEKFFILRRTERDMIRNVHCLPVKYLSNFNETWIFLTYFLKILKKKIKFHENLSSGSGEKDEWT